MSETRMTAQEAIPGRGSRLAGRIIGGLVAVALLADAAGKLFVPEMMIANSPPLGLPADPAFYRLLGAILAISTALYAWRPTALLGAILITGYLGGAIACHLRVGSPLLGFTLFGLYLGIAAWAALWLGDTRLRALLAVRER